MDQRDWSFNMFLYLDAMPPIGKRNGNPAEVILIRTEKMFMDKSVILEFQALSFSENRAPEISHVEEDFLRIMLDKFVMSVTALNNYLKCPLEFYFKNLVRIPSPKNEATEFGSSVHHALEQLFRKMTADAN